MGICAICGRSAKLYTCSLCGKLVCGQCMDHTRGICLHCAHGKRGSHLKGGEPGGPKTFR